MTHGQVHESHGLGALPTRSAPSPVVSIRHPNSAIAWIPGNRAAGARIERATKQPGGRSRPPGPTLRGTKAVAICIVF
jgi:hypothetical protein